MCLCSAWRLAINVITNLRQGHWWLQKKKKKKRRRKKKKRILRCLQQTLLHTYCTCFEKIFTSTNTCTQQNTVLFIITVLPPINAPHFFSPQKAPFSKCFAPSPFQTSEISSCPLLTWKLLTGQPQKIMYTQCSQENLWSFLTSPPPPLGESKLLKPPFCFLVFFASGLQQVFVNGP